MWEASSAPSRPARFASATSLRIARELHIHGRGAEVSGKQRGPKLQKESAGDGLFPFLREGGELIECQGVVAFGVVRCHAVENSQPELVEDSSIGQGLG